MASKLVIRVTVIPPESLDIIPANVIGMKLGRESRMGWLDSTRHHHFALPGCRLGLWLEKLEELEESFCLSLHLGGRAN